jgi:hypothetical protein
VGFISRVEHGVVHRAALAKLVERARQSARAAVRLKRQAVPRRKVPPHAIGLQSGRPQIVFGHARCGIRIDAGEQLLDPRGSS